MGPINGDPSGFATKDEVADYVEAYAAANGLDVRTGVHVESVETSPLPSGGKRMEYPLLCVFGGGDVVGSCRGFGVFFFYLLVAEMASRRLPNWLPPGAPPPP